MYLAILGVSQLCDHKFGYSPNLVLTPNTTMLTHVSKARVTRCPSVFAAQRGWAVVCSELYEELRKDRKRASSWLSLLRINDTTLSRNNCSSDIWCNAIMWQPWFNQNKRIVISITHLWDAFCVIMTRSFILIANSQVYLEIGTDLFGTMNLYFL